ncbi:MAG: dTDP-4-dehydrorhamnose 3,5-epimerase [Promethearchaeota archaeon]
MKFIKTKLNNLTIIKPEPFHDNRGYFGRIYCKNDLKTIKHFKEIVQMNQSLTKKKGTIRGMHFQYPPHAEIKIIKCLSGSVFDVAIDLRNDSNTFLQWHGEILSAENMKMIYIPEGFAHGFQTLEDDCELLYLHSEFYNKEHESALRYNDPRLNIKWPLKITDISKRDLKHDLIDDDFKGISL